MREPLIHSHATDCLPEDNPLAFEQVHCRSCGVLVHAGNNECMQTWFEFEGGNACAQCVGTFPSLYHGELLETPELSCVEDGS